VSIEEVLSAFRSKDVGKIVETMRRIHDVKSMVLADVDVYGRDKALMEAAKYHAYNIVLLSVLHEGGPNEDGSLNSIDERLIQAFRRGLEDCAIDLKFSAEDYVGKFYNLVVEELNNVVRRICRGGYEGGGEA